MPTQIPNEAYPFASAHDWLKNAIETGDFDLFALVEMLMEKGLLDGDTIQDIYQDEMDEQGFFIPTREWLMGNLSNAGMVECIVCGEVLPQSESDTDSCHDGEHVHEEASDSGVEAYLEEKFPETHDPPTELYEFGKEKGWWS